MIFRVFQIGSGRQIASVGRGSRNGTCIHQSDGTQLAVSGLGAFTVGEIPCGVADGEAVIQKEHLRRQNKDRRNKA